MSTDPDSRGGFGPYLEDVGPTFHDNGEIRTIRYGVTIEDLERALELHGEHVAAFLVEPIQSEAGIVVPPSGYLSGVRELCTKHNVLLICDEIQTGLGRTGKMLCCEHDQIRHDIVLLGKALSGGVSLVSAVFADREPPFRPLSPPPTSLACSNPLGCAVAMTALRVLVDEKLCKRAETLCEVFRSEIAALKSPLVQQVRGKGLLTAIVIDETSSARGRTAWQFCLLLKSHGVLSKPTHVNIVSFASPLVISKEDLRRVVNVITECLNILDRLRRPLFTCWTYIDRLHSSKTFQACQLYRGLGCPCWDVWSLLCVYLHFEYGRVDSLKYDDYFTESPPFFCHLHFPRVNPVLGLCTLVHSLLSLWSLSILRDLFYDGMQ
ncbi:hypothetical protein SCLCIDRAFT_28567 [Scleroderma citrinum Foug A]|uniref:Ornithine aminotransferase n=1 Tax=Scleroderma citrinum Foug A TaxID=1036808 RepID=A0A0C2ZZH1_9AGAM|nr:hypothetical protein SCLCIDRAFT_28567 [Scleroderma citrinum Foug A]